MDEPNVDDIASDRIRDWWRCFSWRNTRHVSCAWSFADRSIDVASSEDKRSGVGQFVFTPDGLAGMSAFLGTAWTFAATLASHSPHGLDVGPTPTCQSRSGEARACEDALAERDADLEDIGRDLFEQSRP